MISTVPGCLELTLHTHTTHTYTRNTRNVQGHPTPQTTPLHRVLGHLSLQSVPFQLLQESSNLLLLPRLWNISTKYLTPSSGDTPIAYTFNHNPGQTHPPNCSLPESQDPPTCSLHILLERPPQPILPHTIFSQIVPPHSDSRHSSSLSPHTLL